MLHNTSGSGLTAPSSSPHRTSSTYRSISSTASSRIVFPRPSAVAMPSRQPSAASAAMVAVTSPSGTSGPSGARRKASRIRSPRSSGATPAASSTSRIGPPTSRTLPTAATPCGMTIRRSRSTSSTSARRRATDLSPSARCSIMPQNTGDQRACRSVSVPSLSKMMPRTFTPCGRSGRSPTGRLRDPCARSG